MFFGGKEAADLAAAALHQMTFYGHELQVEVVQADERRLSSSSDRSPSHGRTRSSSSYAPNPDEVFPNSCPLRENLRVDYCGHLQFNYGGWVLGPPQQPLTNERDKGALRGGCQEVGPRSLRSVGQCGRPPETRLHSPACHPLHDYLHPFRV